MPAIPATATPIALTADEQRRSRRPRVLLAGRIVYGEAQLTVDCSIRDLTPEGARLKLAGTAVLPQKVSLIELGPGLAHECEVSWRRMPEIGVRFLSTQSLKGEPAPDPSPLKRLWQGAQPR